MAEFTTVEKNGHFRHIFQLKPGERVSLCRCYASKTFPFCDGSHKTMPHNIGPVVVEVPTQAEEPQEPSPSA